MKTVGVLVRHVDTGAEGIVVKRREPRSKNLYAVIDVEITKSGNEKFMILGRVIRSAVVNWTVI